MATDEERVLTWLHFQLLFHHTWEWVVHILTYPIVLGHITLTPAVCRCTRDSPEGKRQRSQKLGDHKSLKIPAIDYGSAKQLLLPYHVLLYTARILNPPPQPWWHGKRHVQMVRDLRFSPLDYDCNINRLFPRKNGRLEWMFPTLKFYSYKTKSYNHYISIRNMKKMSTKVFEYFCSLPVCAELKGITLRWHKNVFLQKK